jgi:hypothetical protein
MRRAGKKGNDMDRPAKVAMAFGLVPLVVIPAMIVLQPG